mgnify:CR=1 FL=1
MTTQKNNIEKKDHKQLANNVTVKSTEEKVQHRPAAPLFYHTQVNEASTPFYVLGYN